MKKLLLKANNIYKNYGNKAVLKGINLEVHEGQIVALLGPNGAGKTTFFYNLVGLVPVTTGSIFFKDREITHLPMHKRGSLGLGYLPQENSIFRDLTVAENILAILELKIKNKQERQIKLESLLEEFNIKHIENSKGLSLSGGERRRVEIARCLALNPKVILLDEPFAGVDPIAVGDIKALINHLKEKNIGVIITDHNVKETLEIVDKAYIVYDGTILISGSKEEVINDKKVKEVYLGEDFI